jgi:outer membrane receptor protein involved in Fe transport
VDHKFPSRTYVSVSGERLLSTGEQTFGVFDVLRSAGSGTPSSARRNFDYEERSAGVSLNQLLGERWSLGANYRWTEVDLDTAALQVAPAIARKFDNQQQSLLHQVDLRTKFTCECGFFAQADAVWEHQANRQIGAVGGSEEFWQFNASVGYRFWQRRAEARLGILNLTDQDYRLNPLTVHVELPRDRTFYASLKLYF